MAKIRNVKEKDLEILAYVQSRLVKIFIDTYPLN